MLATRVGYCGGKVENPTYRKIADYTETLQVDFNPTIISFEKILDVFFTTHSPSKYVPRQYQSFVFYHSDVQKGVAQTLVKKHQSSQITKISRLGPFYVAEDYHQKYRLRNNSKLFKNFKDLSPAEFREDFTVMRLNALLGNAGNRSLFEEEIDEYSVPKPVISDLLKRFD